MEEQTQTLCAELGRLPDEESRNAFLTRSPELVQSTIVEQLADLVRRQVRVDVPGALTLAEAAIAIARELREEPALALSLRAKANALWFMGQCRPAVELFREAALLFESAGNMSEVGRTLSSSIQSLSLLSEYEQAFAAAERARGIFVGLGDTLRLARLEINVANIYHRQNHFAQALAAYKRAYEQLLPHKDVEGAGVALHNIAVCLIALDDFHGALETYERMHDLCRESDMPLLGAQADYNIAYLFYLRGDYSRALELLRVSRESCRKNGDKYHLALCDLDESEIYLELRLIDEAAEKAQKSLDQFKDLGIDYEAGRSLANLGLAASLQGDGTRAVQLFRQAKQIMLREAGQVWPALLDFYQALMLFEAGDLVAARRLCQSASECFGAREMGSKHVLSLSLLARVLLKSGELEEAAWTCEEAIKRTAVFESPILSYETQFIMGQIYEAINEPHNAFDAYQRARSALDTLRGSLETEELKIAFMKDKMQVYARLVELCLLRDSGEASKEEAFSYMEEAKSRALRDLLFNRLNVAGPARCEENETDRRIRERRQELNWCYHRIEREQLSQEGAAPELVASLQLRARAQERELLQLVRELPANDVAKTWRSSGTATLAEIRASLGPDAELVEYFCIGDRLLAAVLTAHTLEFIHVTEMHRLVKPLRMLQFQFAKFRLGQQYVSDFQEALQRATLHHLRVLYDEVFAPVREHVNGRHLVIVPSGLLHALPFHALFDGQRFLIDSFTVSYAPSASIHALCHGQPGSLPGPSLILGVDDPNTPFLRQEVEAVAAVVPEPEVLVGSDATEQALRDKGSRCRILHIATHGYFRQDSPMFSAIRLAGSYLSLYDLYDMDLPVDLLTLSGCGTGLDVIAGGDEILGLARGLLHAGARSLLLSLWDVDDRSTAELMGSFYSHLLTKRGKAEALRSAMLDLRSRHSHPYHWAPFRLMGRASAN